LAAAAAVLAALVAQGCARLPYAARELDVDAAAEAFQARRVDDPGLRSYMAAHGIADAHWPLPEWGLSELTLLAFFYRPELEVARAHARAARAEAAAAAARLPLGASPRIEHHSADGAEDTPWSLGFELEIPLGGQAQRSALSERAEYLAQAAMLQTGLQAWKVRSEVRAALLEILAARQRVANLDAELALHLTAQGLLERRLEAGYASVTDVSAARLRVAQVQADLAAARTSAEIALGALAQALAVPRAAAGGLTLSFADLEALPQVPDEASVRRSALNNRVDLRASLLQFAASDASVKLEVARQYPTLALRPGYLWDQGDNVWSLALDLVLPAGLTYGPQIRAAEARREAAAQAALAHQAAVIGEVESRAAAYRQASEGARAAAAASRTQVARSAQLQKQFDVGQSDRLELTLARAEALLVERRRLEAQADAQRHAGLLEDAMQAPLAGGPLPALPQRGGDGEVN
jgi:outer membrane protein TolC